MMPAIRVVDQDAVERAIGKQLEDLARRLRPSSVLNRATLVGAGLWGATYDLGNGFVAKRFGDPAAAMGEVGDPTVFAEAAERQLAIHALLRAEGFPCVPAMRLKTDPTWIVMKKADGAPLPPSASAAERAEAIACCARVQLEIERRVRAATAGLDLPAFEIELSPKNAHFVRRNGALTLAEFFDPGS
jgi:hypothetical protein